ncbi:MAG: DNA gyrase inhibitor YacG [Rhodoferax sp.]
MSGSEPSTAAAPKRIRCPNCGGDSVYATSNPFRPFCSEHCKNVDLGAWASESFRMPVNSLPEDQLTEPDGEFRSSSSH